nr:PREDICTED: cilia- and flagella-associated protein 52 isoform X1 [Megachile rotundata]
MGNKVTIKNAKTGEQFFLAGHTNFVSAMCISPKGNFVASGQVNHYGFKAMVIIWDFATRKIKSKYEMHKVRVEDVCFTSDEQYLISLGGMDDGCVVVWDVQTETPICGITPPSNTIIFSFCFYRKLFAGTFAGSEIFGNATIIARTNISGRHFITAGDRTMKVWSIDDKNRKVQGIDVKIGKLKRTINCAVVDENDEFVYCGTTSGDIIKARLNIQEPGKFSAMIGCYSKVPKCTKSEREVFFGGVRNLLFLPNKKLIVGAGDGTVEWIEITEHPSPVKGKSKKNLMVTPCIVTRRSADVCAAVTSLVHYKNGLILVGTALCEIHEIELSSFRTRLIATCHTHAIQAVVFPRNCSEIFATAGKNDIRIWKLATPKELLRITVPNFSCSSLCFDITGGSIISAWNDGTIRGFATNSGQLVFAINCAHTKPVTVITITNDGCKLISGGCDGQIRLWHAKTEARHLLNVMKEHRGPITSLEVSPDNESFISSSLDGTCVMWNLRTLERKFTLRGDTMYAATCFVPDGTQVLTCGSDRNIAYWETLDGSMVRQIEGSTTDLLMPKRRHFVQRHWVMDKKLQLKLEKFIIKLYAKNLGLQLPQKIIKRYEIDNFAVILRSRLEAILEVLIFYHSDLQSYDYCVNELPLIKCIPPASRLNIYRGLRNV